MRDIGDAILQGIDGILEIDHLHSDFADGELAVRHLGKQFLQNLVWISGSIPRGHARRRRDFHGLRGRQAESQNERRKKRQRI